MNKEKIDALVTRSWEMSVAENFRKWGEAYILRDAAAAAARAYMKNLIEAGYTWFCRSGDMRLILAENGLCVTGWRVNRSGETPDDEMAWDEIYSPDEMAGDPLPAALADWQKHPLIATFAALEGKEIDEADIGDQIVTIQKKTNTLEGAF